MKRIFLDTNILLDVFLEREPFVRPAQMIWTLAAEKKVQAAISAISVNNVFFIVEKLSSSDKAYTAIQALAGIFKIVGVTPRIINKSIEARYADFEDAVQYFSALEFRAKIIISRDPAGFVKCGLPVMDGAEYLSLLTIKRKPGLGHMS